MVQSKRNGMLLVLQVRAFEECMLAFRGPVVQYNTNPTCLPSISLRSVFLVHIRIHVFVE